MSIGVDSALDRAHPASIKVRVDVDSLLILAASPVEMGIDHIGKGTNQVETEALKALPLKLGIVEPQ
jgi:hypothetical protein